MPLPFSSTQIEVVQAIDDAEQKKLSQVPTFNEHQSSIIPRVHSRGFNPHYQGFGQKAVGDRYQWPHDGKAADDNEGERLVCEVPARVKVIPQLYHRTLERAQTILDRDLLLGADHLPLMLSTTLFDSDHRQDVNW